VGLAIAGATFAVHLAVGWRYGFFRDELYFIDCGRHPSFGYVDQPPLIPLLAAATQAFGPCLLVLRGVAALGHAGLVIVTAALAGLVAEEAGLGGSVARVAAAAAVALTPMYYGLTSTLNTTTFEPLAWTAIAVCVARAVMRAEPRRLVAAGAIAGVALEAKYAAPFFVVPLVVALAAGRERAILWTRAAAAGAALSLALALPSTIWQVTHHLPFRELLRAAAAGKNLVAPPWDFLRNQLLVMNLVLAPLWIAGVVWGLIARRLARLRFLPLAFVAVLVEMVALHGKDYYVAPAYGVAFALGGAWLEARVRATAARGLWLAAAVAMMAWSAPTSMPLLSPPALAAFLRHSATRPQAQEGNQKDAVIPQLHADMLGWRELEARVASVWRALPPDERARAAIITSNYGEAGALNFFGPADGLPRALSGHNQYGLWGPGDHDGSIILRINGDPDRYRALCAEATVAGIFGVDYAMPHERGAIVLCRRLRTDLRRDWEAFVHID
jgi:hypothetical protein